MTETKTNGTAAKPRDPHAAWWVDYQHKHVDYAKSALILEDEDTEEENQRMWGALTELMEHLLTESVTTFEGFGVQLDVLQHELADGRDYDDRMSETFRSLRCFVSEIEAALKRRHLRETIERAGWGRRCYSADAWKDHPAMPADVAEICRSEREPEWEKPSAIVKLAELEQIKAALEAALAAHGRRP